MIPIEGQLRVVPGGQDPHDVGEGGTAQDRGLGHPWQRGPR